MGADCNASFSIQYNVRMRNCNSRWKLLEDILVWYYINIYGGLENYQNNMLWNNFTGAMCKQHRSRPIRIFVQSLYSNNF
jgi:hypothetical protein